MTLDRKNPHWIDLANDHRQWLKPLPRHLEQWERLHRNNIEAALCEAGVRRRLEQCGVAVAPNESLVEPCGGPDFRCEINNSHFYVEVTCISIATAKSRLQIQDASPGKCMPYNVMGMAEAVFAECQNKAPQCADLDAPVLIAIGTFLFEAEKLGFDRVHAQFILKWHSRIAWDVSPDGSQAGDTYETTSLKKAAFLKPEGAGDIGFARRSISGLLLCGLGTLPGTFRGVLNPNAVRPFDRACLPSVEFGVIEFDRNAAQFQIWWSTTSLA